MVQNLDKIISDLKFVNEKLINRLDKIEPVLAKDKYQIEDVDFLKSVDFQVERFESFIEILLPLLETDDEGVLLKKSLIHNFLYSTLLKTKKRFDAIFNDDYQFDDDKLNDYKTRFFELGYCVEFIDNFIDDLRNQRLCFILLFAYFTNNKGLFDFNELVKTANNESDLVKRKKLYLSEYDRVNLIWLKTNNSFKSNIPLNPDETDETEPYNEETDEDYQETKRYYFNFLDNCQKAIESINFLIKNSSQAAVPVQEPKPRTIIDEIKEEQDRINSPEYKAQMEEGYDSFYRKLTNKEIELVRNDCKTIDEVYVRLIPAPTETIKIEEKKIIHNQINHHQKEISLSNFLKDKTDLKKLIQIQDEFSTYNGKRMAIMIYLLISEFNFIKIVPHSKTHSRTQFIRLFKNNYNIKTQSIDKYFNSWDNGISIVGSDIELLDIKAKLTKIIENQVV